MGRIATAGLLGMRYGLDRILAVASSGTVFLPFRSHHVNMITSRIRIWGERDSFSVGWVA